MYLSLSVDEQNGRTSLKIVDSICEDLTSTILIFANAKSVK